jgi:hypothetical protein
MGKVYWMKYISNNEADGVLERLLQAEIGRASRNGAPCAQFDPDLSTAYIERNLTPRELTRYEVHLAACSDCRIQVAKLARLGYADTVIETGPGPVTSAEVAWAARGAREGASRLFAYLLQPQWIAAGTAGLVLLLALPVFIILRNAKPSSSNSATTSALKSEAAPPAVDRFSDPLQAGDLNRGRSADQLRSDRDDSRQKTPATENPTAATVQPGDASTGVNTVADGSPSGVAGSPSEAARQKTEAEEAGKRSEGTLAQNTTQPGRLQDNEQRRNQPNSNAVNSANQVQEKQQSPAPLNQVTESVNVASASESVTATRKVDQPAASEQISQKEAQTLPEDDKKTGVTIVRPGGAGTESRAREGYATIRPKDSEPPKDKANHDETERGIAKKGPARDFAGGAGRPDVDSVHKPATPPLTRGQKLERRVDTKRFRMQAGIWTDRDFKPGKEIPAVSLTRDTELYKSALEKQPALKAFLAGFSSDERVIVVYKGIVYKILPSKN